MVKIDGDRGTGDCTRTRAYESSKPIVRIRMQWAEGGGQEDASQQLSLQRVLDVPMPTIRCPFVPPSPERVPALPLMHPNNPSARCVCACRCACCARTREVQGAGDAGLLSPSDTTFKFA